MSGLITNTVLELNRLKETSVDNRELIDEVLHWFQCVMKDNKCKFCYDPSSIRVFNSVSALERFAKNNDAELESAELFIKDYNGKKYYYCANSGIDSKYGSFAISVNSGLSRLKSNVMIKPLIVTDYLMVYTANNSKGCLRLAVGSDWDSEDLSFICKNYHTSLTDKFK